MKQPPDNWLPLRGKWLRRFLWGIVVALLAGSVIATEIHPLHLEVSRTTDIEIGSSAKMGVSTFNATSGPILNDGVYPNGSMVGFRIGQVDWVVFVHKAYFRK